MRKVLQTILAIFFLANTLFTGHAAAAFRDIPENHPAAEAIEYIEQTDHFSWRNAFRPEHRVTQGEFLKALLREYGFTPKNGIPKNRIAPYIKRARELDIIDKQGDFKTNAALNRIDALSWVLRAAGYPIPKFVEETETGFTDVPKHAWYVPVILLNKELNIMDPLAENRFGPKRFLTREVAATLIYRLHVIRGETAPQNGETLKEEPSFLELPIQRGGEQAPVTDLPHLDLLLTVWKKIHESYIEREKIDREKLMYDAIAGLVKSIDDPYTVFNGPENTKTVQENLQGEIEGIGAFIMLRDGKITVISPIKDSPAAKAGIQANDIILEVDGENIEGLSVEEVAKRIRGKRGTQVQLRIRRDATLLLIIITRDKVIVEPVRGEVKAQGKIAYIDITSFSQNTVPLFEKIMIDFFNNRRPQPEGLIIDLRNNPGGFLDSAIQFLGHFVESSEPVVQIKFPNSLLIHRSPGPADLRGIPMVIIQNKGSASASEIVAGTLQDLKLATIIGTNSFGKGTVQELNLYADGSSFKLTIAKWLTGKGRDINGEGVKPDIFLEQTQDDQTAGRDPALDRAIEEVIRKITLP